MHRKTNDNYLKKRKPIIALVCEGKIKQKKIILKILLTNNLHLTKKKTKISLLFILL